MSPLPRMRPIGFGFLCCGLGLLLAAAVAGPRAWLGIGLPLVGLGVVFLARSPGVSSP